MTKLQRTVCGGYTNNRMQHFQWPLYVVTVNKLFGAVKQIGFASDFKNEICLVLVDEIIKVPNKRTLQSNILNTSFKEEGATGIVCQSCLLLQTPVIKPQSVPG